VIFTLRSFFWQTTSPTYGGCREGDVVVGWSLMREKHPNANTKRSKEGKSNVYAILL